MVTDLISQIAMRINWRVVNRQYLINLVTADHQLTNKSASISSKYLGSQCMVMGLYHWLWIMGSKRWKLRTQDNIIILLQTCFWPNALLIVHILTDILKYRNWSYFSKWTQNWISLINTDFSWFFLQVNFVSEVHKQKWKDYMIVIKIKSSMRLQKYSLSVWKNESCQWRFRSEVKALQYNCVKRFGNIKLTVTLSSLKPY